MTIPRHLLHPRHWASWLGVSLLYLLTRLPLSVNYQFGRFLGECFYRLAGDRKHVATVNLTQCFPELSEAERQRLLRETMWEQGIGLMETLRVWFRPIDKLGIKVEFIGQQFLENDDGVGIIVIGTHFTGLDTAGALIAKRYAADSFYRPHKDPVMEFILSRARGRYGEPIQRRDAKRAFKRLRQGHRLFYLPDQDYGRKSAEFVDFFGLPAATTIATTTFAKSGRARVVYINQQRLNKGRRFRIEVIPLDSIPSDDPAADARLINATLEANIRQVPAQYMWVHRRFKTRPEGAPKLYKDKDKSKRIKRRQKRRRAEGRE
ncbi:lipid A biosynthesis lauroyl acyltransferase [Spongiibacter sp. KMU-158]|uniref:Lipid A biosynthesis lauroyl acyltransferase n=1 Tax=Spongiibacter pelagi TaxID=2760804 RepID=A0A927C3A8_9GAMM|nr:lipid A biosynthesis lauroyl acyltransferase [Spongiibacter pelagi]MBD2859373.1 lipid A biosynthesis lauroyl acyltransferase [Spongiibacter pelagi]